MSLAMSRLPPEPWRPEEVKRLIIYVERDEASARFLALCPVLGLATTGPSAPVALQALAQALAERAELPFLRPFHAPDLPAQGREAA